MEVIEKYMQILLPLFIVSKNFQSKNSSICNVIPSLLMTMHATLMRMILVDDNQHRFRLALVKYIKTKFAHELGSDTYLTAAILHVGDLNLWRQRSFAQATYINAQRAIVRLLEANYKLNRRKQAVATTRQSTNFVQHNLHTNPTLSMLHRMSRMSVADDNGDTENDNGSVDARLNSRFKV